MQAFSPKLTSPDFLTTIVADACFLIALEGSGNLFLLRRAKRELKWRIIVPTAVYQEATKKEERRLKALLDDSVIQQVDPEESPISRLSRRYPMLGKGEIEAMGYVLALSDKGGVFIVSDDQRAVKAIRQQQLSSMSTLDFLSEMCHRSVIKKLELLDCIPRLRKVMWISEETMDSFKASL